MFDNITQTLSLINSCRGFRVSFRHDFVQRLFLGCLRRFHLSGAMVCGGSKNTNHAVHSPPACSKTPGLSELMQIIKLKYYFVGGLNITAGLPSSQLLLSERFRFSPTAARPTPSVALPCPASRRPGPQLRSMAFPTWSPPPSFWILSNRLASSGVDLICVMNSFNWGCLSAP